MAKHRNKYRSPILAHPRIKPALDTHDLPRPKSKPRIRMASPWRWALRTMLTVAGVLVLLGVLAWGAFHGVRIASTWGR